MSGIAGEIAALDAMTSAALHARWIALTNSPVPRVSPNLLRLALAWEIQVNASAGSARTAGRMLNQFARRIAPTPPSELIRLTREWRGRLHVVTIEADKAIRWDSRTWNSLSEVARAITRLLADVAAGQIDIVLVYKVDRLSRSLFDFAKLIETFERAGASFASITQALNTTSSMGRLTLNMLLSFAQFEREVTAERIRDKLAASKAKGMWMGGVPPLGYRPDGRSLAVIAEDAALVRHIFSRYLALGNVRRLEAELKEQNIVAPVRTTGTGRTMGGRPFTRGMLYLRQAAMLLPDPATSRAG